MKRFEFYWCDGTGKRDMDIPDTEVLTSEEVIKAVLDGLYGSSTESLYEDMDDIFVHDKECLEIYTKSAEIGQEYSDGDFNIKRIE